MGDIFEESNKKANRLFKKRKTKSGILIHNFFVSLLYWLQFLICLGIIAGLGILFYFTTQNIGADKIDTCISVTVAIYGFLLTVFAIFLSHEAETYLNKRYLSLVLRHPYLIHNFYAIILIPTILFIGTLVGYYCVMESIVFLCFTTSTYCFITICVVIYSIMRDKNKLLISYYLPWHRRFLIDSILNIDKDENIMTELSKVSEEDLLKDDTYNKIIRKNIYLSNFNRAFTEFYDFFMNRDDFTNNDIKSFTFLLKSFRIKAYDFDSMLYYRGLCFSVVRICEELTIRKYQDYAINILFSFETMTKNILESKSIKEMFVNFESVNLTVKEIAYSTRMLKEIKACWFFNSCILTSGSSLEAYKKTLKKIPHYLLNILSDALEVKGKYQKIIEDHQKIIGKNNEVVGLAQKVSFNSTSKKTKP